jgi:O-antigen/teichoic acid export membrane protein
MWLQLAQYLMVKNGNLLDLPVVARLDGLRYAGGFIRNVCVLLSGATMAMIIPVIAAPLLTRLYTPDDYGVFALYVSVVSILSVSVTGNYDSAIMLPKKDEDAFNIVAVCFVICFFLSTILFALLLFFGGYVTSFLGNPNIATWLRLVPFMVFIIGAHQAFNYWANRKKQFRSLAINKVTESATTPVLSLLMGLGRFGVSGLVLGLVGGKVAAAWMLGRQTWQEGREGNTPIKPAVMAEQAKRYYHFPLYAAPTSVLDVLALQAPVLFLTKIFGAADAGLFSLTTRVIGAPLALVGVCIGQVYHQSIAEARHRNDNLTTYVLKVAAYMALIASPLLFLAFFFPSLFSVIFGQQWRAAGEYARILIFPLAVKFVVSPLATIMPVSGNLGLGAAWKVIYFVATCVTLYAASRFQVKTFLYIYSIQDIVLYGLYFLLILKASKNVQPNRD